MATQHATEAVRAVQHAATLLSGIDWLDPRQARQLSPMAEAVANMFMVVYYQAETGRVSKVDFQEAMASVRQSLKGT